MQWSRYSIKSSLRCLFIPYKLHSSLQIFLVLHSYAMASNRLKKSAAINGGFTLIEMLISLGISSVVAVMMVAVMKHSFDVINSSQTSVERLSEVQIAWHVINQDLLQIVPRPVRTSFDTLPAYGDEDGEYLVSFTRGGIPRLGIYPIESGLVRVAYQLEDNTLYRITWPVLDRDSSVQPLKAIILSQVKSIEFEKIKTVDPMSGGTTFSVYPSNDEVPNAIKVKLELADKGLIERVLPGINNAKENTTSSSVSSS